MMHEIIDTVAVSLLLFFYHFPIVLIEEHCTESKIALFSNNSPFRRFHPSQPYEMRLVTVNGVQIE